MRLLLHDLLQKSEFEKLIPVDYRKEKDLFFFASVKKLNVKSALDC